MNIALACDTMLVTALVTKIKVRGKKMLNDYITELKKWLDQVVPAIVDEKNFLYLMGGLFLLGVVSKWVVLHNYGRLIKRAEDMQHTKSGTIRQIKNKYESILQVNGVVENPMLFVQRHLNKCKVGYISLNKLNNIINYCVIITIGISGIIGLELYMNGSGKTTAMSYILVGCFFGFTLEMIDRSVKVHEKKMELTYIIVDYLANGSKARGKRAENKMAYEKVDRMEADPGMEVYNEGAESIKANQVRSKENEENARDEQILNQVIGEFLQ